MTDNQHALCYGGKSSTSAICGYRPQALHNNLNVLYPNVPYLHPQSWNNRLETFHLPETMKVFLNLTHITKIRINPQQNKNQPPLAE